MMMTAAEVVLSALTASDVKLNAGVFLPRLRPLVPLFDSIAPKWGIDPQVAAAVAWRESGFITSAVNSIGCVGLMQICPPNFAALGWDANGTEGLDAAANINAGCRILSESWRREGSVFRALARYGGFASWLAGVQNLPASKQPAPYVSYVTTRAAFLYFRSLSRGTAWGEP